MPSIKLDAGVPLPETVVPRSGGGELVLGRSDGWTLLVVYRGKHCPLCRTYLKTLTDLLPKLQTLNVSVQVVSGDPEQKATAQASEENWPFPLGYGLTVEQMRTLGLYISTPRSAQETDRPFPEPALFLINPDGNVQIVDISNAPFARPDLNAIVAGIELIQQRTYPIRGTH